MKHEHSTGKSTAQHWGRALKAIGLSAKQYRDLIRNGAIEKANRAFKQVRSIAFGRGKSRKISVLLVPELRKRRSERDPALLAQQIKDAGMRLANIRDGRVGA